MARLAVFDLDGTLVDSAPDIHAALDRLMASRGLAPFSRPEVKAMIGDGVTVLVQRACAARGIAADDATIAAFSDDYTAHAAERTALFAGVPQALAALDQAGWRLAVCTNKPQAATEALLAALGIGRLFAAIGAGDSFPVRKPDPRHLLATLREAGTEPGRAVMVGDHRNDVLAASGAGLPCVFALWGYGPPEMAEGCAALARDPAELPALFDQLVPR